MNFIPSPIEKYLQQWFDYKLNEIYCQVASQTKQQPQVRTMRLYSIDQKGCLEFLSRVDTQKWTDWQLFPEAAICFFNQDFGQILCNGEVMLKTIHTHPEDLMCHWNLLSSNIQKIYMRESRVDKIPECFGAVSVVSYQWEILKISDKNYLENERTIYKLVNKSWLEQKIEITS